ncbi:MAG: inositol monophosphatase family protein [Leptolyngbyaceae cyanobacterium RU_5_1]|nr:inositol monophosphatase family protein [Leptolyngbyaceae cyanobacterium RU_5_1]
MKISPDQDLQIRQVIRHCGLQAAQMAAEPFEIFEKGLEDYVTSVDSALDIQLSAAFSDLFPKDGVISEENTQSRQRFCENYARLWCIDPLDGTEDFIHGKHGYAVMAGLLEDYQPVAGWIYAPTQDRMFYGGQDWGLFEAIANYRSVPLAVVKPDPPTSSFCPIVIGYRDQKRFGRAIAQQILEAQFYSVGSFGLKVMEVISGRAGLYLYLNQRVKLWDTTGPLALANAAGLVCCSLEGHPIKFSPDRIDPDTLVHQDSILVGWPDYIDRLRPKLEAAVQSVLQN